MKCYFMQTIMESENSINIEDSQESCSSQSLNQFSSSSTSPPPSIKPKYDLGRFSKWHLNNHFGFQKFTSETNFIVKCLLCEPKHKLL